MAIFLALLAAVFLAVAAVLQQRAAAEASPNESLHLGLFAQLLRRRLWLLGFAAMLGGYALQGAALGSGSIVVVEPLLAVSLLIALALSATWSRQPLPIRDWAAAVAATAGIAGFIGIAQPREGAADAATGEWLLALSAAGGWMAVALLIGVRAGPIVRAVSLAAAGGIAFGLTDVLTKNVVDTLSDGPFAVLTAWQLYAAGGIGFLGFYLVQNAYHAGHIASSLPAVAVLEPIVGSLLGIILFRERIASGDTMLTLEIMAALVAAAGVIALARSPLVTGAMRERAGAPL